MGFQGVGNVRFMGRSPWRVCHLPSHFQDDFQFDRRTERKARDAGVLGEETVSSPRTSLSNSEAATATFACSVMGLDGPARSEPSEGSAGAFTHTCSIRRIASLRHDILPEL